jgi:penicillin-binding protein 2
MRFYLVLSIFAITWIILIFKVYSISINSNSYYEKLAQKNTLKTDYIPQVRGIIFDRNKEPLAVNKLGFSIDLSPKLSKDKLNKYIDKIIKYFPEFKKKKLLREYNSNKSLYNHSFITIINFIEYEKMIKYYSFLSMDENINIKPASRRFYPNKQLASHVLGYVSKANLKEIKSNEISKYTKVIGKTGIERFYNSFLDGELGFRRYKVTAQNVEIEELETHYPKKNNNIELTIDLRLQKYVEKIFHKKTGAVIVMDANNGELLSASSFPEYDINMFVDGISYKNWQALINDLNHPFTNKLINGHYPPGSVVKMGVGISFLENGLNKNDSVFCTGEFPFGKRNFRCWKTLGHGSVNLTKAIRESCDDYFYKNSLKVGINKISKTLKNMGLGNETGIDLPNEFKGTVPNKIWKRKKYNQPWYVGETLNSSIGQGHFLVTPIQIATHTAVIATGKQPIPHFIKKLGDDYINFEPLDNLLSIQKENLPKVRKGMEEALNHPNGTATKYMFSKVPIAGKTGTAQVVGIPQSEKKRMKESELKYFQRSHAWLTTYVPQKKPKYVITVLVEHGGHGGSAAGGITSKIVNKMKKLDYF